MSTARETQLEYRVLTLLGSTDPAMAWPSKSVTDTLELEGYHTAEILEAVWRLIDYQYVALTLDRRIRIAK